jgi:hypothetical protein
MEIDRVLSNIIELSAALSRYKLEFPLLSKEQFLSTNMAFAVA